MIPILAGMLAANAEGGGGPGPAAAHDFWRIYITEADNDGPYISLSEMQFASTVSGAALPVSSADGSASTVGAIYSDSYSGSYPGGNAFDGAGGTFWATGSGSTHWLGYHFPSPVTVNEVRITARSPDTFGQSPKAFTVQSSDDGIRWANEWAVANSPGWAAAELRAFPRP